jgi:transposase
MNVLYERCCGLDLHKRTVVACLVTPGPGDQPRKEIQTFSTDTRALLALGDWLAGAGCTHIAMEGTGVYWKPVYNLLEDRFVLLLANAQHIKAVPGRKTDVKDCEWIADLLRHGLLQGSFVPDREQRELRELTRYRSSLVQERAAEVNRLQKTLEGANIKLASVLTRILGASGRAILRAIVAGEEDPAVLASKARGSLRNKRAALERVLEGRISAHQRFLLGEQLRHIEELDESIERVSAEIEERLRPFEEALERLDTIPGVGRRIAEILVAEIGVDMTRFPSPAHLASWAGMCPGNNESAGKRRSGRTRRGSPWLRAALVEAAHGAQASKGTFLGAQYRRLAARQGGKRAAIAVGHSILVSAYCILARNQTYEDLGDTHWERTAKRREQAMVERLRGMGYTITPPAA